INYYPLPEARKSNLRHRPIGIGVQGFADTLIMMRFPYESEQAMLLNQQIFETIYYGALEASCELAERDASTAQILGNNESFEPYTSNIYTRRVLSGEFNVVNHHLLRDLTELDLWDEDMKNKIISNRGSVQAIEEIPKDIRDLYKTVWEISVKSTIKMAADRGAFIDQSQSFNIHVAEPNYGKLTSIHFHAWKSGLKTVDKTRSANLNENRVQRNGEQNESLHNASSSSVAYDSEKEKRLAEMVCSLENKEACMSCANLNENRVQRDGEQNESLHNASSSSVTYDSEREERLAEMNLIYF
ncbi:hypothetical protein DOY81_008624, partial [Sarcophaga bullata]